MLIINMQIKTTMKKTDSAEHWRHGWRGEKMEQSFGKPWYFPKKLNIHGPYDPGIPFLGIYLPSKMKAQNHVNTFKQIFVAALFVNSPKQETTQIFINKYINKLLYLYNGILLGKDCYTWHS